MEYGKLVDGHIVEPTLVNGGLHLDSGIIVFNPQKKHYLQLGFKPIKPVYLDNTGEEVEYNENYIYDTTYEESDTMLLEINTQHSLKNDTTDYNDEEVSSTNAVNTLYNELDIVEETVEDDEVIDVILNVL